MMKKFLTIALTLTLGLTACQKKDDTPAVPQSGIKMDKGILTAYPAKEIAANGLVALPEITEISAKVFEGYKALKSVEAPKLTKIGAAAFKGSALTSLTLGATVPDADEDAFAETSTEKNLVVPEGKVADFAAFAIKHGFKTINGVATPGTVIEIKDGVLTAYPLAKTPENGVVTLDASVKEIAANVFEGNTKLKEIHAPKLTKIGAAAFKGTGLTSLTLGDAVPEVGEGAFEGTSQEKNLVVPADKVASFIPFAHQYGFKTINGEQPVELPAGVVVEGNTLKKWPDNIARQEKVVLPSYITKIATGAFMRKTQIVELIGPGVEEIADKGFGTDGTVILRKATFPKLKKIGYRGVYSCTALTSFEAPLLEEVGLGAFWKSSNITEFNFPLLKVAPTDAFRAGYNGNLKKVVLPAVTSFGDNVFNYQNKIESIELGATPPTGATATIFDNELKKKNPKVIVPASAVDTYKAGGEKWLGIFVVEAKTN